MHYIQPQSGKILKIHYIKVNAFWHFCDLAWQILKNNCYMKEKERYFSPETEVKEIRLEGMIAQSGLEATGFVDGGDLDELFI